MKFMLYTFFLFMTMFASCAGAGEISGTWKFEKEVDYGEKAKNGKVPTNPVIQVVDDQLILGERCAFQLAKEKFDHGTIFQLLMKGGESDKSGRNPVLCSVCQLVPGQVGL